MCRIWPQESSQSITVLVLLQASRLRLLKGCPHRAKPSWRETLHSTATRPHPMAHQNVVLHRPVDTNRTMCTTRWSAGIGSCWTAVGGLRGGQQPNSSRRTLSSHPRLFFLSLSSFSMAAHICDSSAYCRRHFILFVPSRTCWATWWSRNHFNAWPNHHRVWLQWCCPARFCRRETYASHFPQRRPCAITSPSSFLEVLLHSRTPHSDALRLHRKQSIVSCAFLFLVALDGAFVLSCTGWESKHQDKKTL